MKKILTILTTLTFLVALCSASQAFAARAKCTVVSTDGSTVVFDCGKKAKRLKVGNNVTVTSKKKDKGGC